MLNIVKKLTNKTMSIDELATEESQLDSDMNKN